MLKQILIFIGLKAAEIGAVCLGIGIALLIAILSEGHYVLTILGYILFGAMICTLVILLCYENWKLAKRLAGRDK